MAQKQITHSISLAVRGMQIKTTLTFHLITASEWPGSKQMTAYAGEDVGKGEHLFIAGRSANLYIQYENQCGGSTKS